ncbi:MAG: hypothetical protein WCH44_15635 [Betaproteobacteria bacterium]
MTTLSLHRSRIFNTPSPWLAMACRFAALHGGHYLHPVDQSIHELLALPQEACAQ